MDLQTLLPHWLGVKLVEWETKRELRQLSDRALADIGIGRGDIDGLARTSSQGATGSVRELTGVPLHAELRLSTG